MRLAEWAFRINQGTFWVPWGNFRKVLMKMVLVAVIGRDSVNADVGDEDVMWEKQALLFPVPQSVL